MSYTQDPPFAVQIELVEGCTLACEFCGVQGMRERPGGFKFMDVLSTMPRIASEFKRLADEGWNPRFEFAMHGEPTAHPATPAMVRVLRDAVGPKASIIMLSNATPLLAQPTTRINDLMEAGLTALGLDDYEPARIASRALGRYEGPYRVLKYPEDPDGNVHRMRGLKSQVVVLIQDISVALEGNHAELNSHCGAGREPQGVPLQQRCAKPFRELSIRWDGGVSICCNDFRGVFRVGNVNETPIDVLWRSETMDAARRRLYHRDRTFAPCDKCDARSYRVGLLPDKYGRETMEEPTARDAELLAKAVRGPAMSSIVLRTWERR